MWEIWLIGFLGLGWIVRHHPKLLRFNFRAMVNFIAVDLGSTLVLAVLIQFGMLIWPIKNPTSDTVVVNRSTKLLVDTPTYTIALAGLEDVLFVAPTVITPYPWKVPVGVASSLLFATCHKYQGTVGRWSKLGYVPLATYFGMEYGILTTIIGHSTLDVLLLTSLKWSYSHLGKDVSILFK